MNNIYYQHGIPEIFQSRLIKIAMSLFGMKHKTERKMISNGFAKQPAKIPDSLLKHFNIKEAEQDARKIYPISPAES